MTRRKFKMFVYFQKKKLQLLLMLLIEYDKTVYKYLVCNFFSYYELNLYNPFISNLDKIRQIFKGKVRKKNFILIGIIKKINKLNYTIIILLINNSITFIFYFRTVLQIYFK